MKKIKKAVFPVAGLGTRFLPATKANPKEMMPVVDKPLIQYAVEEAMRAGIEHMIFITSASKRSIEDHFDKHYELETRLREQGKNHLLDLVQSISPQGIQFTYVRQAEPLGLGHAVLCAEHVVGNEPFAVLLADDLIDETHAPCLSGMVECYQQDKSTVFAVQPVEWDVVHQYGVVKISDPSQNYATIEAMVEKPNRADAPSNLAAVGRYIFTPEIFQCLKQTPPDNRGEIQLTDSIKRLLSRQSVFAYQFQGKRFDCGSKLGYLQATVELSLRHPELGASFHQYLKSVVS